MTIHIRTAKPEETEQIMSLLRELALWFKSKNSDQWSHFLLDNAEEEIASSIQKQETYVLEQEGKLIGTFSVLTVQNSWDKQIWGWESNSHSLYVHRLAIRLKFQGRGLGKKVLNWIENQVSGQVDFIRLDCVKNNDALNKFYLAAGFHFEGEVNGLNKYSKVMR